VTVVGVPARIVGEAPPASAMNQMVAVADNSG